MCRTVEKPKAKVNEDGEVQTKYEIYKESYVEYNNTDKRKDFMKDYNRNYRIQHSNPVECECGIVYKDISKYAHAKSKRHNAYFEKKNKAEV